MGQTMPWREGGRKKAVSRRKKSTCEFCVHLVYEPKREIKNKKNAQNMCVFNLLA